MKRPTSRDVFYVFALLANGVAFGVNAWATVKRGIDLHLTMGIVATSCAIVMVSWARFIASGYVALIYEQTRTLRSQTAVNERILTSMAAEGMAVPSPSPSPSSPHKHRN